jgi:hypothetical protein
MSGVADTEVIDLLAQDADGRYLAVMIEERPWGSDPEQRQQLRDKFNSYATFIADGQYAAQVPAAAGHPVTIQLRAGSMPTGEFADLIEFTGQQLARFGIALEVMVVDYL